jgi:hypothetical protein
VIIPRKPILKSIKPFLNSNMSINKIKRLYDNNGIKNWIKIVAVKHIKNNGTAKIFKFIC